MASARKLGYFALVIAVACKCTPETAFEKLQSDKPSYVTHPNTKEELQDMQKLQGQGLSYNEICEIYGLSLSAVRNRLRRGA